MAKKLFNPLVILHFILIITLLVCIVAGKNRYINHNHHNRQRNLYINEQEQDDLSACPIECDCKGLTVDCAHRGLQFIPKHLPKEVRKLHLEGNNITVIRRDDLLETKHLRILQLMDNQIQSIDTGAFDHLIKLERLRLNHNSLRSIHELLFNSLRKLKRLDLSHNKITSLGGNTFHGTIALQNLLLDNNEINCIDDDTFDELKQLEILTLNKNNITTLDKATFKGLHKLRVLRIADNPFHCDCHLAWFSLWLKENPRLALFTRCSVPFYLRSKTIAELPITDFKCNGMDSVSSRKRICSSEPRCPLMCSCQDDVVDCRDRGLTSIPAYIPDTVTELRLEQNRIHELPSKAFTRLKRLRRIDLSNNKLSKITPDAFYGLKSLTSLVLYGNMISDLPEGIFKGLHSLQLLLLNANNISCIRKDIFTDLHNLHLLSLYDNKIQSLGNSTFNPLNNIQTLHLGKNPFICDCNLKWLSHYLRKYPIETSDARCDSPKRIQKRRITALDPIKFRCRGSEEYRTRNAGICLSKDKEYTSNCVCESGDGIVVDCSSKSFHEILDDFTLFTSDLKLNGKKIGKLKRDGLIEKCDACFKTPCKNDGLCQSLPSNEFRCTCAPGYYGKYCENKIDACFGNPCDNGAACKVQEAGRFACHCLNGFEGDRCETNVNDCVENKCENGECEDLIAGYRCKCKTGYSGEYCERKIEYCSKDFQPCKNGGTCINQQSIYKCTCPLGWTGDNCTINVDDCIDNLCQNGATCVDEVNSYHCKCGDGFSGNFCEIAPVVDILYPKTSPCQQHDCKNGVCFAAGDSSDYECKCSPGYTGKHCEKLSSVTFERDSYLQFTSIEVKPALNVSLTFITKKTKGILLYIGENEHLAIELYRGRIRISLNIGNYPVSTMFSYEEVNDNKYHTLEFILIKKNFTMKIDSGQLRTIVNEGSKEYFDIEKPLYIGGLPESIALNAIHKYHVWNESSFEGCMTKVMVNDNLLDLMEAKEKRNVSPGCSAFDEKNICNEENCRNGHCIQIDHYNSQCKCKHGWSGVFCTEGPTCQKQVIKDYYMEEGCRSSKKIKHAYCTGNCGNNCCKAIKSKTRSIKMICDDGSEYIKSINIVRKCGCSRKC